MTNAINDKEFDFHAASDRLQQLKLQFVVDNVFIDITRMLVFEVDKESWYASRHAHSSYEFHYIYSGSCFVKLDHASFTANAGEFYITAPGVYHSQGGKSPQQFVEFSILCTMKQMDEHWTEGAHMLKVLNETPCRLITDCFGCMESFQQCLNEIFYQQPGFFNGLLSYLKLTLLHTARAIANSYPIDCSTPSIPIIENKRFRSINDFVIDNLFGLVTPIDVARHMNLSTKQVGRIVMKELGITTSEFIRRQKISEAKKLLLETRLHIGEIAERLSFTNEYYFNRVFRSVTGTTPGAFREMHGVRIR
jgi:AraC-like DNA-binding protein/quercetin dioxygenase-like cupin family protein